MSQIVDYEYYTDTFGGTKISESDFTSLANRASARVNHLTFGRAAKLSEENSTLEEVKNAICAVAEVLQAQDERGLPTGIESETNDGYSINYGTRAKEQLRQEIFQAAADYLAPTHLMYRGVLEDDD